MADASTAAEVGKKFWDNFVAGELEACADLLADDFVRIGPHDGVESDIIRGKKAYVEFLHDIKTTMPAHGGKTYTTVGSPDGRIVFVRCMEVVALKPGSSDTIEVQVVLLCYLNDDGKIREMDIFWKQPSKNIDWTDAQTLSDSAQT